VPVSFMSQPSAFVDEKGPGMMASMGSLSPEKEQHLDGIVKSQDKAQHGGAGFATVGSIAIAKDPISHGIVRAEEKPQYGGSGFAASASIAIEKDPIGHGIVHGDGMDRPQYGGSGFASQGSIAISKQPTAHGIVHDGLDRPQHGGPGFASMGSIHVEKEKVSHGIIRGDAKINDGPIDAGSDAIQDHIRQRQEAHLDPVREAKARQWLETILEEKWEDGTSFLDNLKSGKRLCEALNRVYPNSVRKINDSKTPYLQMENIGNYIKACKNLGMNKSLIFETQDLYEDRNLTIVVDSVYELARAGARKGLASLE